MILQPEMLNRIYADWHIRNRRAEKSHYDPSPFDIRMTYQNQPRSNFYNQRFEDWLYVQGFSVKQKNGKRYLHFTGDEKRLTWFLIKYGVRT